MGVSTTSSLASPKQGTDHDSTDTVEHSSVPYPSLHPRPSLARNMTPSLRTSLSASAHRPSSAPSPSLMLALSPLRLSARPPLTAARSLKWHDAGTRALPPCPLVWESAGHT